MAEDIDMIMPTNRSADRVREERPARVLAGGVCRCVNFVVAFVLILLSAPFFLFVAGLILVADGWPILYKGPRLGRGRRLFVMYKFRTLVRDAESQLSAQLATHRHDLMIPLGKMLRDSRLDELPQLINVLIGDMDIVGPRPERESVYEKVKHLRGYEKRFLVKPGLLGLSQMFTPHNTPKRLRVRVDNKLIRLKQSAFFDILMAVFGPMLAIPVTLGTAGRYLFAYPFGRKRSSNLRESDRIRVRSALVTYTADSNVPPFASDNAALLLDINEQAFLIRCNEELPEPFPKHFRLVVDGVPRALHKHYRHKRKSALCEGELVRRTRLRDGRVDYVVKYEPVSQLNYYMVHQYFLKESYC
ncbi:sugar transferase [Candidatus Sumerlaeota bacterium]|nr:sugar transferase [Candidatus Sumerlaeota bacterium]